MLDSARAAIDLLDRSDQRAPTERTEALAAWAWAEAVAGSVEEAERLLEQLSCDETAGDPLRTYDAGHARALSLMRRGQFTESYGPSIAAGEAIAKAGRPDLAYGCWANAASAATAAGEHERAIEFIDRNGDLTQFYDHLHPMLDYLLPQYLAEGKSHLVVAVGCTGGRHRSVAIAEHLAARYADDGSYLVDVAHRDEGEGG